MDQTVSAVKAMSLHSGDTDGLRASKWKSLTISDENAKLASTGDCGRNVCLEAGPNDRLPFTNLR
jgi:hypothetical protein